MDPELVQELRQLREAVEQLRHTFESGAGPAVQRDLAEPEARLRKLSALFEEGVISDADFENGKATLLAELVEA